MLALTSHTTTSCCTRQSFLINLTGSSSSIDRKQTVIISSDTRSSSGRISGATDKAGDTDTSFTSTVSSEQGPNLATRILQRIGEQSEKLLDHQRNVFRSEPPNPHLKELAKFSTYSDNERLNWKKANEEVQKQEDRLSHHHEIPTYFVQGCYTQANDDEKVGRVWIPFDPTENPNIGNETHVRTKHHKLTEQIVRMVEDQIENTRKVFEIMRLSMDRFPTVSRVGKEAMMEERQAHAVLALRLKGVEVCEWWEDAERWEVYFERPDVKMGGYLDRHGPLL